MRDSTCQVRWTLKAKAKTSTEERLLLAKPFKTTSSPGSTTTAAAGPSSSSPSSSEVLSITTVGAGISRCRSAGSANGGGGGGGSSGGAAATMRSLQLQLNDFLYDVKFSDLSKFLNASGRYQCPRRNCDKNYKDASSLQRHIRYECGGMKKFRCVMCGKAFSQGSHLKRHLESGVCIKYYF